MTIVLHNPRSRHNRYCIIDQSTYSASGWYDTIENALLHLTPTEMYDWYYHASIEEYQERYNTWEVSILEGTEDSYEYW